MKWPTLLVVATLALSGCGSDDDDSDTTPTGGDSTTGAETSDGTAVFEAKDVGFTFEYPEGFAVQKRPAGDVLGQVSLEPGEQVNAIKVRKTSDEELGTESYLDEFQRDFARSVAGDVEKREETIGDIEVGILEFEDSYEDLGETVEFTSTSYFFPGGGKTWQIECIAATEQAAEIDEACRAALESIEF